ncbi:hypothetical protein, partial [Klebsiella variicola]|uniref:hypothetical protein n=1 Tax=Klebsiella variicola TaxID=244366 RepID=UPI001F548A45
IDDVLRDGDVCVFPAFTGISPQLTIRRHLIGCLMAQDQHRLPPALRLSFFVSFCRQSIGKRLGGVSILS